MMEKVRQLCKEHNKSLDESKLWVIEEDSSQNSDFILMSQLLFLLEKKVKVIFLGVRENYTHYLSLCKKMGTSFEPKLKSQQLVYYEVFMHPFCSQLPIAETSPSCYASPSKLIRSVSLDSCGQILFEKGSAVLIDCVGFIHSAQLCYQFYQKGIEKDCQVIMGGCTKGQPITQILKRQAGLVIKLENDVGGYGKFQLISEVGEASLLWKWVQGSFQLTKYAKL